MKVTRAHFATSVFACGITDTKMREGYPAGLTLEAGDMGIIISRPGIPITIVPYSNVAHFVPADETPEPEPKRRGRPPKDAKPAN